MTAERVQRGTITRNVIDVLSVTTGGALVYSILTETSLGSPWIGIVNENKDALIPLAIILGLSYILGNGYQPDSKPITKTHDQLLSKLDNVNASIKQSVRTSYPLEVNSRLVRFDTHRVLPPTYYQAMPQAPRPKIDQIQRQ